MKQTILAAVFMVFVVGSTTSAQREMPSPDSLAKLMARYQEAAQPGPEHELLKGLEGKWTQDLTMWPEPGGQYMTSTCMGEATMILGGRFLQIDTKGVIFGMDGQSMQLLGFDRRHKKYTIVGFDTQGTYYVTAAGDYDPKTSTLTLSGEDIDPIFNMVQKYDFVIKIIDKDTHSWSIIFKNPEMTHGEKEFKMLEIMSKRVK